MEAKANSNSSIKGVIDTHSYNALSEREKPCRISHQTAVNLIIIIVGDEKTKVPLGSFRP